MADSKHTITINTKATPDTSTPTQTVAPSQLTRPVFSQPERQSMVNKQAYSIQDEQAAQGISVSWGEALKQSNKEWNENVEAANTLATTEDGLDFGATDTVDVSAVEEAMDEVFNNINEVIKGYDPLKLIVPTSGTGVPVEDTDLAEFEGQGDYLQNPEEPEKGTWMSDPLMLEELTGMKPDYGRQDWGPYSDDMQAVVEAGLGGSSPSAATAIQVTGAMALQPVKAGRDIMAQQLEQSAMGAKVATSLLSGGNVNPSSSGGGGGGASDALSFAGGDGGGGGGIDEMLGGKIDEIFSAPLKPVDMFIDGMEIAVDKLATWTAAIEESYTEVMGFSGAMIGARVETELALLQKRMERAQALGEEFAGFEDSRRELLLAFEDLKTVLLKIFLPVMKVVLKILARILKIIVAILEAILSTAKVALTGLAVMGGTLEGIFGFNGEITRWVLKILQEMLGDSPAVDRSADPFGQWLSDPPAAITPFVGLQPQGP